MQSKQNHGPVYRYRVILLGLLVFGSWGSLGAATFDVTRFDDPVPDECALGDCSLREAVIAANENGEADMIMLPAGIYTLSQPTSSGDDPEGGSLDITADVTVQGAGARETIVDGGGLDRVFDVYATAGFVYLNDLTARNGVRATGSGGGILNRGTILTISRCTVTGNSAPVDAGGLLLAGTTYLFDSTLSGNTAVGDGGGLRVVGKVTIVNSTISSNSAGGGGGGIHSDNTFGIGVHLSNTTISGNIADADDNGVGEGGGIWADHTYIELSHTIIADNQDLGGESPDCTETSSGSFGSLGFNLVGDTTGCPFSGDPTGNLLDIDPLLGSLANNGGPTDTYALDKLSPAIDAGDPGGCTDRNGVPLTSDQRGYPRPLDGDGDTLAVCDLGAVESGASVFADGFESGDTSAWFSTTP
ncbi:MAG: choice-of-anchor Q domain-containing protein [Thermoanaerobaculia bacterium]